MKVNWRFILSKWWKIGLLGLLIATGITLFPRAQCALAKTCDAQADKWCGGGKCCAYSGGLKYVDACAGPVYKTHGYRCSPESGTCRVSDWMGWTDVEIGKEKYHSKTQTIWNGMTYVTQAKMPECDGHGHLLPVEKWIWATVDCCGGDDSNTCTPSYAPPTIDDSYTVAPPNPLPWGQEQPPYGLALGMTISDIKAHAGADTACGSGRASITSISVQVRLRQESIDWILHELGQRYIGVYIKGSYPQSPERPAPGHPYYACSFDPLHGAKTPDAELDCQFFRPLDPGRYDVIVTACQSDGKCTTTTLSKPIQVWLLETTLYPSDMISPPIPSPVPHWPDYPTTPVPRPTRVY